VLVTLIAEVYLHLRLTQLRHISLHYSIFSFVPKPGIRSRLIMPLTLFFSAPPLHLLLLQLAATMAVFFALSPLPYGVIPLFPSPLSLLTFLFSAHPFARYIYRQAFPWVITPRISPHRSS
jgi:hypothetical protein